MFSRLRALLSVKRNDSVRITSSSLSKRAFSASKSSIPEETEELS
eukprot:CAMPEP_0169267970 /NCGR_PEP_ID=MMETSP1016-20121227/47490_1 /TAXON_ID=342587 /ORGANISM="Karlodinium micrum, Strain CCMP2283" /LENGTH=44 /DNA_ID= /DNA_START= /DNA_END= /DNA_ORIENTATION=